MKLFLYASSEVHTLHLETTTRCNAACPMCMRTVRGGRVNPILPIVDMTIEEFRRWISPRFIRQLKRVYLCGNYGDPAAGRDSLEICQYLRETNPSLRLDFFSNGSMRNEDWWRELARVVTSCRFAIDGLEDTNHIYRRGTSWPRLVSNIRAFIQAGCAKAEWDYIVFRHNEHQIEMAKQLAADLGFARFRVKKTSRFEAGRFSVQDQSGRHLYDLEPPRNPDLLNEFVERSIEEDFIQCKVAQEKSIFVSAEGYVFPCCWSAGEIYDWRGSRSASSIRSFVEGCSGGFSAISLRESKIEDIIDGEFFRNLPQSWKSHSSPAICARICGTRADAFKRQFTDWSELGRTGKQ